MVVPFWVTLWGPKYNITKMVEPEKGTALDTLGSMSMGSFRRCSRYHYSYDVGMLTFTRQIEHSALNPGIANPRLIMSILPPVV